MAEAGVMLFLLIGAMFLLIASIGVARMPDLFSRMQAATKAATLGVGSIALAAGVYFGDLEIATRALLIIAFLFLTAPIAAHVIARSAYFVGVPLWEGTIVDELRGRYDVEQHTLVGLDTDLHPDHEAPVDETEGTP